MKTFHDLEYENRLNCLLDNNVGGVDRLRKRKIFINNLNNNIVNYYIKNLKLILNYNKDITIDYIIYNKVKEEYIKEKIDNKIFLLSYNSYENKNKLNKIIELITKQ